MSLDFDGQNRYQRDISAKTSISLFRSAIVMPLITARASSQGRIGMIHNQSSPVRVMRID